MTDFIRQFGVSTGDGKDDAETGAKRRVAGRHIGGGDRSDDGGTRRRPGLGC